ncbi:hypothetical protein Tco_0154108 [Tanacetum coccineum]
MTVSRGSVEKSLSSHWDCYFVLDCVMVMQFPSRSSQRLSPHVEACLDSTSRTRVMTIFTRAQNNITGRYVGMEEPHRYSVTRLHFKASRCTPSKVELEPSVRAGWFGVESCGRGSLRERLSDVHQYSLECR